MVREYRQGNIILLQKYKSAFSFIYIITFPQKSSKKDCWDEDKRGHIRRVLFYKKRIVKGECS